MVFTNTMGRPMEPARPGVALTDVEGSTQKWEAPAL